MSVVIMERGSFKQTPINAPVFGSVKGIVTSVGYKMDSVKFPAQKEGEQLFPLTTSWNGHVCHWPLSQARKMFGFYEAL